MRVFICGHWTGDKVPFAGAENALRAANVAQCFGPHDITFPPDASDYERARLRMRILADCDTVALLDGYSNDPVAAFEAEAAKHLGMRVVPLVILLSQP